MIHIIPFTIICTIILLLVMTIAFLVLNKRAKKALEEKDEETLKDIDNRKKLIEHIVMVSIAFCAIAAIVHIFLN